MSTKVERQKNPIGFETQGNSIVIEMVCTSPHGIKKKSMHWSTTQRGGKGKR